MSSMSSPCDPIFWTHHCFIDKLWAQWQSMDPKRISDYGGRDQGEQMVGLSYKVSDVMDISKACYSYSDLPAKKVEPTPLPPPNTSNTPIDSDSAKQALANAAQTGKIDASVQNAVNTASTVKMTPATDQQVTTLSPDDRSDVVNIRPPTPVSSDWIQKNHLNETRVRQHEDFCKQMSDKLNALKGYISPCSMYFRPEMWSRLTQTVKNFTVTVPGAGTLSLPCDNTNIDPKQLVSNLRSMVQKYFPNLYQNPTQIQGDLEGICGKAAPCAPDSASNLLNVPVIGQSADGGSNTTSSTSSSGATVGVSAAYLLSVGYVLLLGAMDM